MTWVNHLFEHYFLVSILLILVISFVVLYIKPAWDISKRLSIALKNLKAISPNSADHLHTRAQISSSLEACPILGDSWREFSETLHQQEVNDSIQLRSTVQANAMFMPESIIDANIHSEFFKHLPGILTGLGIIGTFMGLIDGLSKFKSDDIATVGHLVDKVTEAFTFSAVAIICAIAITVVEKILYARAIAKLDELTNQIDEFFTHGVDEEYLSQLVKAAEGTHDKTRQLKDSLVNDLKAMMQELTAAQIASMEKNNQVLGQAIASSINDTLAKPLEQIGGLVRTASGNQGEAVQNMLAQLMQRFMAELEGTLGTQMRELNGMMLKTAEVFKESQQKLDAVVEKMGNAGADGTRQMALELQKAQADAALHHANSQKSMEQFIKKMAEVQSTALDGVLAKLSTTLEALTTTLQGSVLQVSQQTEKAAGSIMEGTGQLTGKVDSLLQGIASVATHLDQNVTALSNVTRSSIEGLNEGAKNIGIAAAQVTTANQATDATLKTLATSTTNLSDSSRSLQQMLGDYAKHRADVANMVNSLTIAVENAKKDASLNTTVLQQITSVVEKIREATTEYESKVPQTLIKNFDTFGEAMTKQVVNTWKEGDEIWKEMAANLRATVQELNDYLERTRKP